MATYVVEEWGPCGLCNRCADCEGEKEEGMVWHVLENNPNAITMCIDCLREKGLLW